MKKIEAEQLNHNNNIIFYTDSCMVSIKFSIEMGLV